MLRQLSYAFRKARLNLQSLKSHQNASLWHAVRLGGRLFFFLFTFSLMEDLVELSRVICCLRRIQSCNRKVCTFQTNFSDFVWLGLFEILVTRFYSFQ